MIKRKVEPSEPMTVFLNQSAMDQNSPVLKNRQILSGPIPMFKSKTNSNRFTGQRDTLSEMIIERDETSGLGSAHLRVMKIGSAKDDGMYIEKIWGGLGG